MYNPVWLRSQIGLSKQDSANFTYGTEKVTAGTAGLEQKGQYTLVERAGKVAGEGALYIKQAPPRVGHAAAAKQVGWW